MESGGSTPTEGEMVMDRLPRRLLAVRVADKIVEGIAGGALQPGGRIIESDIVRSLGVSRAPIREAMKMLEAHGIVRARERP